MRASVAYAISNIQGGGAYISLGQRIPGNRLHDCLREYCVAGPGRTWDGRSSLPKAWDSSRANTEARKMLEAAVLVEHSATTTKGACHGSDDSKGERARIAQATSPGCFGEGQPQRAISAVLKGSKGLNGASFHKMSRQGTISYFLNCWNFRMPT